MPSHLPRVSSPTDPAIACRFATGDGPSHPLHQTPRKVNHLLPRPADQAQRIRPVAALRVGLIDGPRPVLIEEDEKLEQSS